MINILEHDTLGATIRFDQHELLLVMALVQEGQVSLGYNTGFVKAADEMFSLANILVEDARRRDLKRPRVRKKIHLVTEPNVSSTASREGVSDGLQTA